MCKCPKCGQTAPDVEDANWVIDGQPYCRLECYDQTINEMLEELYQKGQLPGNVDMAFHVGG
jgi:hypothetical protein